MFGDATVVNIVVFEGVVVVAVVVVFVLLFRHLEEIGTVFQISGWQNGK
jgi:hypothetical protein